MKNAEDKEHEEKEGSKSKKKGEQGIKLEQRRTMQVHCCSLFVN